MTVETESMADRATKAALDAEKEFKKFLDDLNQYEYMKVYDDEQKDPGGLSACTVIQQPLGNYDEDDVTDGFSEKETEHEESNLAEMLKNLKNFVKNKNKTTTVGQNGKPPTSITPIIPGIQVQQPVQAGEPTTCITDNQKLLSELDETKILKKKKGWKKTRFKEECLVQEIDEGRPCLACEDRCTGFTAHEWRNTCSVCKCPRELHDIYNENFVNVRDRLGWNRVDDPSSQATKEKTLKEGYSWVPPGLTSVQIEDYMEQLPNHKVPRLGSPGEKYRDIQLIYQLPKQDLSSDFCKMIQTPVEVKEYKVFRELRDNIAMDIGVVKPAHISTSCYNCSGEIEKAELVAYAKKLSPELCWHPACFVCVTCEELLVDLTYCQHGRKLYCERHYAELIRPRCPACDELIFSSEYTKAMDTNYHKDHLACKNCDKKLIACRYILKEEHPYCIPCYQELFAHSCEECKKPIGPDYKDLSYKEHHWHEFCFKCFECEKTLVDQPFAPKNDKIFCADCHDNNFAARCDGCGNPFRGGMKKFEYKGKQWHEECFCCLECTEPIRNKSFIPREEQVVCVPCYEEKYAQRCSKCNGVINKGGVAYKNMPWHRECFTCSNCTKELAKEKFTSKDDQPYCAECYGDMFAKKCCRCTKPITGFGGTKFISFEERHWHSDCFVCYKCDASMVGRGFLMNEGDILCPECGR